MKQKPLINIWDAVGTGVIISWPTGILVSNQTGGTACLQSSMEGFYIPVGNDILTKTKALISPEEELTKYFLAEKYAGNGAVKGIDKDDAENISDILKKYGIASIIEINIDKLKESHEAWIHVNINMQDTELLNGFDGHLKGVLTWSNSD